MSTPEPVITGRDILEAFLEREFTEADYPDANNPPFFERRKFETIFKECVLKAMDKKRNHP